MTVNDEIILKLERLSRIKLTDEERNHIKDDFEKILKFFDKLNEVDTDSVEPLIYVSNHQKESWRSDVVKNELTNEEALKNSSKSINDHFTVPKFLD